MRMAATAEDSENFWMTVLAYYAHAGRHDLPWRLPEADGTFDPYKILLSEIMLQQTQVPRVTVKYQAFLDRFPTVQALAAATLGEVLVAWQGLGYNRRAKFLWQAAQKIVHDFGGNIPEDQSALESLPGVGTNTAGAIRAYAFNSPAIFIETNIRTAYIHHFFRGQIAVADADILVLLKASLSQLGKIRSGSPLGESGFTPEVTNKKPASRVSYREFYWALMDYGSYVKQTAGNASRQAKGYAKQPKFEGSSRQLRGRVLRMLVNGKMTKGKLIAELADARTEAVLVGLLAEGLVRHHGASYELP